MHCDPLGQKNLLLLLCESGLQDQDQVDVWAKELLDVELLKQ